nr:sodium-dependent bicarbonate transport family permease [Methylobacterium durans]
MTALELAQANLLSPAVLCFALGAVAAIARSDLRLPEGVFAALSMYLMVSIGLRGGAELRDADLAQVVVPMVGALGLCCLIPLWSYAALRRFGGLSVENAAALAAHYGSVSAVTFAAVTTMLDRQAIPYEGYAAALLATMEVPAIVVAIALVRLAQAAATHSVMVGQSGALTVGGFPFRPNADQPSVLAEVLSSKSIVLLAGGLAIGALVGPAGLTKVKPFFADLFPGALCLFLLELGRQAASRWGHFDRSGPF